LIKTELKSDTVLGLLYTRTTEFTKDSGCKTNVMVGDSKFLLKEIPTRVTILMVNHTEKEFTPGQTGKYMTENGKMELKMGTEYGKVIQVNHTSVNGLTAKHKVMVSMFGKTTTSTKGNGSRT